MKKKVFFFQSRIAPYREALFKRLNEENYDLTFLTVKKSSFNYGLNIKSFSRSTFLGLYFIELNFFKNIRDYDILFLEFNIRYIQFLLIKVFFPRKKLVFWGIGVSSDSGFDKPNFFVDLVRLLFIRAADEVVFYSTYPQIKYSNVKGLQKKLRVSGNCNLDNVQWNKCIENRVNLLFIGTLKENKGFEEIISLISKIKSFFLHKVIVIGDGEMLEVHRSHIKRLGLSNYFDFRGPLDINVSYKSVIDHCFLTVLPSQAGLTVVDSMKMGIPVVTKFNSITGGERLYIHNDFNGFLYNEGEELETIVSKLYRNTEYRKVISHNAYDFINTVTSIEKMAKVLSSTFE